MYWKLACVAYSCCTFLQSKSKTMFAQVKRENVAYLLYIVGFLDLFAVSLIIPLFSRHARELGASPTVAGLLGSVYGGIQLFSSPLVGKWSDLSGRRHVLVRCLLMSAVGYALLGMSTTIFVWFLSRIPTGLFKHTQELAKAYVADQTPKSEHSKLFGRMNAASSIGFTIGPIVGGHMADLPGSFYLVAMVTASIFAGNVVLVWLMLPEVQRSVTSPTSDQKNAGFEGFHPLLFLQSFKSIEWTHLWDLFLFRFCMGFGILLFRNNFSMMLDHKYDSSPKVIGYVISYSGVVSSLSGLLVGRAVNLYKNESRLLFHTAIVQMLTLVALSTAPSLWVLIACLTPLSLANGIARVCSINLTIERGQGQETGALLGIGSSILSLARMASPVVGGIALEFSSSGPAILATMFAALAVGVLALVPQNASVTEKKTKIN